MNMRRRDFLNAVGLGATAGFVPFLNQRAEAQGGFPKRLLLLFSPNGTLENQFWPSGHPPTLGGSKSCMPMLAIGARA